MARRDHEAAVRACYGTWGETYYEEYYGPNAAYPPVHRELVRRLLLGAKAGSVLDAGCGPASFLRGLLGHGIDLYGFDLTPEMVARAREVLAAGGVPPEHVWEGSVLSAESFRVPGAKSPTRFDAAICIGVLPHIPEEADVAVIGNLRNAVRKNGLVVVEARNKLFSLFTLNRHSYRFFVDELIGVERLTERADGKVPHMSEVGEVLARQFRMDLPAVRTGKSGEPGYDEVLSRTHNPLILKAQFAAAGFKDVRLLFYHYHCLPPMFEPDMPEFFRAQSLAMEDPEDWRGYFMASAFLLAGRRA